jgi:integrase
VLEQELERLRRAARRRDHSAMRERVDSAAERLNLPPLGPERRQVDRQAHGAMVQVREVELAVEEGESAAAAAKAVLEERFGGADLSELREPVLISEAVDAKAKVATRDMARKFRGVGRLLAAHFGDVPLNTLDDDKMLDFLLWYRRLPKHHGKKHGRNRYEAEGVEVDPHAEIAAADREDDAVRREIAERRDLSYREKLAALADRLTPRVTDDAVEKAHARLRGIFEHAVNGDLRHRGYVMPSLLPRYRRRRDEHENARRNADAMAMRATRPKVRSAWSDNHIAALLASPVYRGCGSPHRRWKPGDLVIRDSLYWAPLILLLTGMRPEEVLQLRKRNVIRRNGILAFVVAVELEQSDKNSDSIRTVPIPTALLELGFAEWWSARLAEPGEMLFPEIGRSESTTRLSDIFGKRVRSLFHRLGLADAEEDIYALRKTFASRLHAAGVPDSIRKPILGHKQKDIINRHDVTPALSSIRS